MTYKMSKYDRTDILEGIDINKINCIKRVWHLLLINLDKNFKHEPYLWNGCLDLMQKAINFNGVAIVSVKKSDNRIHVWYMSKANAIRIMNNSNLNEKCGLL